MSHYNQPNPLRLPDSTSMQTSPVSPTLPFYSNPSHSTSTPSLRAFSIRSKVSFKDLLPSSISLRGRSRTRKQKEEPTLRDLIYDDQFQVEADSEFFLPISPIMPNPNTTTATTTGMHTEQTTATATLQRPRSKSRTIIRMLTTKFTPRTTTTSNNNGDTQHKIHFRPPPVVPNTTYSKDQRDAALRARGLLPPLRPNKDLSTQEMEMDKRIPVVPLPKQSRTSGSSENGSSSPSEEAGAAQDPQTTGLSAADLIKLEWEKKNLIKKVEETQRERMNTFKFGGAASISPSPEEKESSPPNLPLPLLPLSSDQNQLSLAHCDIQAHLYPLPPSPSPSSYSKAFSTLSSEPLPRPRSPSPTSEPNGAAFTMPNSGALTPTSTRVQQQQQRDLEIDNNVLVSEPPMSSSLSRSKSKSELPTPPPQPLPAISLTPPSGGLSEGGDVTSSARGGEDDQNQNNNNNSSDSVDGGDDDSPPPPPQVSIGQQPAETRNSNDHADAAENKNIFSAFHMRDDSFALLEDSLSVGQTSPSLAMVLEDRSRNRSERASKNNNLGSTLNVESNDHNPIHSLSASSTPISDPPDDDSLLPYTASPPSTTTSIPSSSHSLVTTTTAAPSSKPASRALHLQLSLPLQEPQRALLPVIVTSPFEDNDERPHGFSQELDVVVEDGEEEEEGADVDVKIGEEERGVRGAEKVDVVDVIEAKEDKESDKKRELDARGGEGPAPKAIMEEDGVLVDSPPQSPISPSSLSPSTTQPTLAPVRPAKRGLTDPSSSVSASATSPTTSDAPIPIPAPRKTLNLFKRGQTISGQHAAAASTRDENLDPHQNQHPNRRPSIMANVRKSVVGTFSGTSSKARANASMGRGAGNPNPKRARTFDASALPPSPTLPPLPPSPKPDMLTASTRALSPTTGTFPVSLSPTNTHFPPQRRPSQLTTAQLSRQQSQSGFRQPVSPVMYNRGSILLDTAKIEDEETRRMTELAFLG